MSFVLAVTPQSEIPVKAYDPKLNKIFVSRKPNQTKFFQLLIHYAPLRNTMPLNSYQ